MKPTAHIRYVTHAHPATANAQTIWSFLSLVETLQSIFGVFLSQIGPWVQLLGSVAGLAGGKG